MFWSDWTALDWTIVGIGGATLVIAVLQLLKRSRPSQWASNGGVSVGGNVNGNVTTKERQVTDKRKSMIDQSVNVPGTNTGMISPTYNNTLNINEKQQRKMSPEIKSGLLNDLSRDRPVQVLGLNGDVESFNFAKKIDGFLRDNEFDVVDHSPTWHMFFDPPVKNINISRFNDGDKEMWNIVVGPSG